MKPNKVRVTLACTAVTVALVGIATTLIGAFNRTEAVPHVPGSTETAVPPPDATLPPDKSVKTNSRAENERLDKAIEPYVAKARAGLPAMKKRFNAGMPKDEMLLLTVRVYDPDRKFEQVFVAVQSWTDKEVSGSISSELIGIKSHKMGDVITFDPKEILDWTVVKSDGTEEGNVVGNFLNTFK